MLKTTQRSVWYSCQKNRLAAATNSVGGESEGRRASECGWVIYGWEEGPQVLPGRVTDTFIYLGHRWLVLKLEIPSALLDPVSVVVDVKKQKNPHLQNNNQLQEKSQAHQKNLTQKTWFIKIAFFVYCLMHMVFNQVLSFINSLVLWAQVVL